MTFPYGELFFGGLPRRVTAGVPNCFAAVTEKNMPRVTNVRLLRGAYVAMILTASVAFAGTLVAATPANPAQPRLLTTPRAARAGTSPASANPLRPAAAIQISQPGQATKLGQPATDAPAASLAPAPAKNFFVPQKPFVPNTGRLQLFRAATKEDAMQRTSERGPLFPQQSAEARSSATKHVMRYQDVSRGAAVVPIKPRTKDVVPSARAPAGQKSQPALVPPPVPEPELDPSVKRLPPLDRTAPRPKLPAGVKLPQEPIKIYPETDS